MEDTHVVVKLCDYCENRNGSSCANCTMRSDKAGRELCIDRMLESKGFKRAAKLRNIVRASEIVLFKDLCRVLDVPPSLPNKITTNDVGQSALEDHKPAEELIKDLETFLKPDEIEVFRSHKVFENLDYVYDCAGMVYGSSIHASGTLFAETDMDLPIDAQTGDCHCDGHYAEELGYIKYDLLSLANLVPIESILGINIDWNEDSADRSLIEGMQNEDLTFTFQFGSPIVDNMIRGVDPKDLDTISLSEITSINRPGPLNINLNQTWVDRKNGNVPMKNEINAFLNKIVEAGKLKLDIKLPTIDGEYDENLVDSLVEYVDDPEMQVLHENYKELRDLAVEKVIGLVLEKKYNIPDKLLIFQEDIMALCSYGAGFTLGEADDIRRAMGKKKAELMASFEGKFIEGWTDIVGIFARDVWDKMVDYAKYCFNKSHAVAYTLVTLKTASLQKYHFDDYMSWNYLNLKNELKTKAAALMEEKSPKKYPTFRKPYEGIQFGSLSFKEIELDETCQDYQMEYEYLSDLFLTQDVKFKPSFMLRGLFDPWTKDILGLVTLKKKLGKKADCGVGVIPSCNSFSEFLNALKMKGYIRLRDTTEAWGITTKVKVAPTDEDWFYIYKTIDDMPAVNRKYRVTSLIKQFGIPKDEDFSAFNFEGTEELKEVVAKYEEIFDRFRESNPGKKITKNIFDIILSKTGALNAKTDKLENSFGELKACVKSIDVKKDGTCKLELQFSNGTRIFYTKNAYIKKNFTKHDIVDVLVNFYKYQGRDGNLKILLNLDVASAQK